MLTKPYTTAELADKNSRVRSKKSPRRYKRIYLSEYVLGVMAANGKRTRWLQSLPGPPRVEEWNAKQVTRPDEPEEKKKKTHLYTPAIPQGEWDALRSAIMVRDELKCDECGETDKLLSVHHIDKDKTNMDPDNLITLCWKHHSRKHH